MIALVYESFSLDEVNAIVILHETIKTEFYQTICMFVIIVNIALGYLHFARDSSNVALNELF